MGVHTCMSVCVSPRCCCCSMRAQVRQRQAQARRPWCLSLGMRGCRFLPLPWLRASRVILGRLYVCIVVAIVFGVVDRRAVDAGAW